MKRFFEEHTSVIIICIVVSLILCILGCIKGLNEDTGKINGSRLLKIVGDNLIDTIDAYQKQAIPNENLIDYSKITGVSYGAAEKPFNTCYCSINDNIIKVTGIDDWAGSFLRLGAFEPGTYTINYEMKNTNHYRILLPKKLDNTYEYNTYYDEYAHNPYFITVYNMPYTFTIDVPFELCICFPQYEKNSEETISNLKLEKGNKATRYTYFEE